MMKKVIILGAGLVGRAMAVDLQGKYHPVMVDINQETLKALNTDYGLETIHADISEKETLNKIIANCDLVIGSVPSDIGLETLKNVIRAGKNIVDISYFPEDPFELNELAVENNVSAIVDCGIAPGMSNIILGYHNSHMNVNKFECYVGGLPENRGWPWEYKTVFPPIECIEEYLQSGRFIENGNLIVKEPLSEPELIEFPGIGKLEGLNSDGLRTLIKTMDIPNMFEKTLRYPGITEYLRVLRDTGFLSYDEVQVGNNLIRPFDLTATLLFPKWIIQPGEPELTAMRLIISGNENNKAKTYTYSLLDRFDLKTNTTSMARTTGFTATAVAELILSGRYNRKGISPPEYIGEVENNFEFIKKYLEERGIIYQIEISY
ncbi:MAG: saccharopine dehydrogenase [candidate division Zixibacteria bacterium]|nr:saccharopine dehydrogenase [candidate division Zixibacteria bacterium]